MFNFISKIGRKAGNLFKKGLKSGYSAVRGVSKGIGKLESVFDQIMDVAHHIPVAKEIVDLIRDNDVYRGVRGAVDDVRGIIEADSTEQFVDNLLNFDGSVHSVQQLVPEYQRISSGISAAINPTIQPSSMNTRYGASPSSSISTVAVS